MLLHYEPCSGPLPPKTKSAGKSETLGSHAYVTSSTKCAGAYVIHFGTAKAVVSLGHGGVESSTSSILMYMYTCIYIYVVIYIYIYIRAYAYICRHAYISLPVSLSLSPSM